MVAAVAQSPIVQQLVRRDRINEATIRHLLQATAAARRKLRADDNLKKRRISILLFAAARTERV
jgi:hypothetical protein